MIRLLFRLVQQVVLGDTVLTDDTDDIVLTDDSDDIVLTN